jgi:hypothetical protein
VPETVVVQVTATFVTLADAFPVPLATAQSWPAGCVDMVTAYAAPLATAAGNVKLPFGGHQQVRAGVVLQREAAAGGETAHRAANRECVWRRRGASDRHVS